MNQNPAENPPAKPQNLGLEPAMVGFHIGDAVCGPYLQDIVPMDKPMAAWLLARILTLQLRQDLLLEDDDVTVFGTLGDGICFIRTRDARLTMAAIRAELERFSLLAICQIGERRADGWHCHYPGPHIALAPLMDLARVTAAFQRYSETITAKAAMLRGFLKKPPGEDSAAAK